MDELIENLNEVLSKSKDGFTCYWVGQALSRLSAAAPQVVADEPTAEDYSDMLRAFFFNYAAGGYNDAGGLVSLETAKDKLEWIVNEAIQHAAPVQAQEELRSALIKLASVQRQLIDANATIAAVAINAPAQPVAVPDGWRDKLVGLTVSMDVSTGDDDAFHRVFGEVEGVMPQGDSHVILTVETSRNFAAPAAQGDALNAKRYEFLRDIATDTVEVSPYCVLGDGEGAGRIIDGDELDSLIDAAIAAKAAS